MAQITKKTIVYDLDDEDPKSARAPLHPSQLPTDAGKYEKTEDFFKLKTQLRQRIKSESEEKVSRKISGAHNNTPIDIYEGQKSEDFVEILGAEPTDAHESTKPTDFQQELSDRTNTVSNLMKDFSTKKIDEMSQKEPKGEKEGWEKQQEELRLQRTKSLEGLEGLDEPDKREIHESQKIDKKIGKRKFNIKQICHNFQSVPIGDFNMNNETGGGKETGSSVGFDGPNGEEKSRVCNGVKFEFSDYTLEMSWVKKKT